MKQPDHKFISYKNERDVLFVLGAGASASEGTLLQKEILEQLFKTKDEHINSSDAVLGIKKFLEQNFDISNDCFPSLESIFGYFDYFISKNESINAEFNTKKLYELREVLIKIIHYIIANSSQSKNTTYKKFWNLISENNRNVSIITMNYDTLLESAFDHLYPEKSYIDYCLELMNYNHYDELDAFDWWINPREPVPIWRDSNPVPIKILKLHGSLDWKYCNCCNQVLLTPWDDQINLNSMSFKKRFDLEAKVFGTESKVLDLVCPLDGNKFETLILPPSHIKNLNHPQLNKLLVESGHEIRVAKKIVFIGYSFPEADVHIKALIMKNITKKTEIHVVDPFLNKNIKANFNCFTNKIIYHDKTFEEFIDSDLKNLLIQK